jgi:hypothetical protein
MVRNKRSYGDVPPLSLIQVEGMALWCQSGNRLSSASFLQLCKTYVRFRWKCCIPSQRRWVFRLQIEEKRTPLQASMDELGTKLSKLSFAIIGVICLFGILQSRNWLDMFTIGGMRFHFNRIGCLVLITLPLQSRLLSLPFLKDYLSSLP